MAFFEDVILTDSIEIKTFPEKIFNFLTGIVDDASYRAWHKDDHVSFRWLKGQPWAEGSVMYVEEYLHGKLHKLKFVVTKIVPNEKIEYAPVSRLLRKFFPKNQFIIEQKGESCLFIASGTYRVGWIGKAFFGKAIEKGLASVEKHMKEEGENLKKILESQ
ncbi:MAG: SRPBCC family protein [Deltaproteobacteria bacterium]|nr:SRPBCC family protein [Deltaproteobacteria bacterium]